MIIVAEILKLVITCIKCVSAWNVCSILHSYLHSVDERSLVPGENYVGGFVNG